MARRNELNPGKSPRAFYGSELRRLREAAGLSQEKLGELVFCSGAYLGQIENASRKPQLELSRQLDVVLKTGKQLERLHEILRPSAFATYFEEAVEQEALAKTISEYAAQLVPGVMQTPEYAAAIFLSGHPLLTEGELADRVAARMTRSSLLDGPTKKVFWYVLDETVLRREVGSPAVMAGQLQHITDLIRNRRVIVQVVPFGNGAHSLMEGMMSLMTFDDAPPLAYIEAPLTGGLLDDPLLVAQANGYYDLLRAVALSPEASLALIQSVAEEYAHDQQ
ncbi:transcriptional regulator with XRE-family HTH domain [Kitasatospora sp. MAP12-15]|uniref:helix-turn-helix domain-containing protein n=1 Tax=unclassified Kitasatospora TaxID=2633591 RepID=UPI0024756DEA|nr:helix-turn-helix transcriptional regulator [Kitasatospora sp. MAP12-44]MDH6112154.1 transcriptional regulator with XRE-family HTH domain [Kitasatospora sp. MAP12-44]